MAISLVQSAAGSASSSTVSVTVPWNTTPTDGNLLVALASVRSSTVTNISGWTLIEAAFLTQALGFGDPGESRLFYKMASSEGASVTASMGNHAKRLVIAEFSGVAGLDVSDYLTGQSGNTTFTIPDITPTQDIEILIVSAVLASSLDYYSGGFTPGTDLTEIDDAKMYSSERPRHLLQYRVVSASSGDYGASATLGTSSTWGACLAIFASTLPEPPPDPEPGIVLDPTAADPIDITEDIAEWVIRRGAGEQITGAAQTGSATIRVRNTDDKYNPENGASPLIDYLRDGTAIWIGINNDGLLTGTEPRGLFGGRITDITPMPMGGQATAPFVEFQCEDALGWLSRTPITLPYEAGRTQQGLRLAILQAASETRFDLDDEIYTMPLSGAEGNALGLLEELNKANGTRHFAKPADSAADWYAYTTYNRQHGISGTADATLAGTDVLVTGVAGWRLSADTVVNQQRASVTPITFTPDTNTVWRAETLPIIVTPERPYTVWVEFDDFVQAANLNYAYSGDAPTTATIDAFGTTAKITIEQTGVGDATTVTALTVEGALARRWPEESWVADDATSQALPRGVRAGSVIAGEYVGILATARGIAEHVVWRYATPQTRPTITVANWFPEMFDLDLGDVVSFSLPAVGVSSQLFEIVGLTHRGVFITPTRSLHTVEYVLQKSRVQADPGWFTWDVSDWDGTDVLGY